MDLDYTIDQPFLYIVRGGWINGCRCWHSLGKTNSTQTSKGEYHDYYDDKKNGTQRRLNEDDTNDTNN